MKRRSFFKSVPFMTSLVIVAALAAAITVESRARVRSAEAMAAAANKFLASLSAEQKAKASFSFDEEERLNWNIIPRPRKGLPLKEMSEPQRELVSTLLKTGLSQRGFTKSKTIREQLELVLREIEKDPVRRDPINYYVSIFGAPSAKDRWGWRFEGHHQSLNFTVIGSKLVATSPTCFGSNPAEVRTGERKGLRVLGAEEDKGRDLLMALDDKQRAQAIFDKTAPKDITDLGGRYAKPLPLVGVKASSLNAKQLALLERVIEEYAGNLTEELAAARMQRYKSAKKDAVYFGWAGVAERGGPHYYRIQGPTFLIEYDNTQNDANHIHAIWREFNGDWGRDLLAEHYRESHLSASK